MVGWLRLLLFCAWILASVTGRVPGALHFTNGLLSGEQAGWGTTAQELLSDEDAITARHLLQELSQQQTQEQTAKSGSVLVWGDLTEIGPTPPEALSGRVVKISAGGRVAMALLDTREVVVWSANNEGQLDVPSAIQGQVADIAAGFAHCLVLLANGSVTAWGRNKNNQTEVPAQLRPGGGAKAVAVAAGTFHSLALLANGTVVAWGASNGLIVEVTQVPAAAQANATGIAAYDYVSLAVLKSGLLAQWGWLDTVPVQQGVRSASAGTDHIVALLRNGSVVAWGRGAPGWAGLFYPDILLEVISVPPAARSHVIAVSAAENITLALRDTGEVVAWGHVGPGDSRVSALPAAAKSGVMAIACGYQFAMAVVPGIVTAPPPPPPPAPPPPHPPYPPAPPPYQPANQGLSGSVLSWGDMRRIGPPPSNVTSGHVIKISAGGVVALALLDTHEVVAWSANNSYGQADVPPAIQGQVADISAGGDFAVSLLFDGSVVAWGHNNLNQTNVPADLQPGGTAKAVSIAAGYRSTLAVLVNGSVVAWGSDRAGLLDVPPAARANVVAVAVAGIASFAVLSDGSLIPWGKAVLPEEVYQYGVLSVGVGTDQVVAALRNGTVVTFPINPNYVVLPTILDVVVATPPAARSNVVAISASENVSMVLRDTGEVVAWGVTPPGIQPISPVPLAAQSNVIAIAAGGGGYCMALVGPSPAPTGGATTQTFNPDGNDNSTRGSKLGTGAVAGIVVGAVALVAVVATGILLLLRRDKNQSHAGKLHVYTAQKPAHYSQVLKGTGTWDQLTKVLRPQELLPCLAPVMGLQLLNLELQHTHAQETFMRSVAQDYSWIIGAEQAGPMHNVEAGVNDTQLDKLQQAGMLTQPVVELSKAELQDQVQLLADGLLGTGGTALVFKCVWPNRFGPNSLLAIKVLKDGSDADVGTIQSFAYEARLLAAMKHPNVVRVYGYCLELPTVCLILEVLPTSLKQRLYGLPAAHHCAAPTQSDSSDSPEVSSTRLPTIPSASTQPTGHTTVTASTTSSHSKPKVGTSVDARAPTSPAPPTTESDAFVTVNTHTAVASPMTLLEIVRTSTDIAAGLAYLHSQEEPVIPESEEAALIMQVSSPKDKRIVHRDLKPANILLNSEGAAKITDFGLARDHEHTTVGGVNMGAGTVQYMAPEQLAAARAGRAGVSGTNRVDVYSLGMMMWEMLAGEVPWQGKTADMIFATVMNHRRPPLPGTPDQDAEHVSVKGQLRHMPGVHDHPLLPLFTSIIQACWHQRDRQRPTAAEVHGMLTQLLKRLEA